MSEHLRSMNPPWIQLVTVESTRIVDRLVEMLVDLTVKVVDGRRCRSKQELLSEFAASLGFPDYFGRNWDAFHECINDLDVPAGQVRGYVILVIHAEELLLDSDADFGIFVEIMEVSGRQWSAPEPGEWAPSAMPFHVLLVASDETRVQSRDWKMPVSKLELNGGRA